jgi:hypothetical protein
MRAKDTPMAKFVPFQDFLQQLLSEQSSDNPITSPAPPANPGGNNSGVTPENLRKMREFLAEQNRNVEVVHSFVGNDGQTIDCITVGSQPGLGGGTIAKPPAGATDIGFAPTSVPGNNVQAVAPPADDFGNVMQCPVGSIPRRRITLEELIRAGSLENFFKKSPGGDSPPQ